MEVFHGLFGLAIAAFSAAMAWLQWQSAERSLAAANKIAADQAARVEAEKRKRRTDFIEVVVALGAEARAIGEQFSAMMPRVTFVNVAFGEFSGRLWEVADSLDSVRRSPPPDASLILDVSKLALAIRVPQPEGLLDESLAISLVDAQTKVITEAARSSAKAHRLSQRLRSRG